MTRFELGPRPVGPGREEAAQVAHRPEGPAGVEVEHRVAGPGQEGVDLRGRRADAPGGEAAEPVPGRPAGGAPGPQGRHPPVEGGGVPEAVLGLAPLAGAGEVPRLPLQAPREEPPGAVLPGGALEGGDRAVGELAGGVHRAPGEAGPDPEGHRLEAEAAPQGHGTEGRGGGLEVAGAGEEVAVVPGHVGGEPRGRRRAVEGGEDRQGLAGASGPAQGQGPDEGQGRGAPGIEAGIGAGAAGEVQGPGQGVAVHGPGGGAHLGIGEAREPWQGGGRAGRPRRGDGTGHDAGAEGPTKHGHEDHHRRPGPPGPRAPCALRPIPGAAYTGPAGWPPQPSSPPMTAVLVLLVVSLTAYFALRLREAKRSRLALEAELRAVQGRLMQVEGHLGGAHEDLVVLTHVLVERGVADEEDLDEIRQRVVEQPIRRAEEREELLEGSGLSDDAVVVEGPDPGRTIH